MKTNKDLAVLGFSLADWCGLNTLLKSENNILSLIDNVTVYDSPWDIEIIEFNFVEGKFIYSNRKGKFAEDVCDHNMLANNYLIKGIYPFDKFMLRDKWKIHMRKYLEEHTDERAR